MSAPWGGTPPPDRKGYKEFIGRPVLTIVGGVRYGVKTQYGSQDVVHVTLVSLIGPDNGVAYDNVFVYTARIAGRLKALEPGSVILSKVVDSGKAPDLQDADQWDSQAATAWWNANPGKLDTLRQEATSDFVAYCHQNKDQLGTSTNPPMTQYTAPPPAWAQPQGQAPQNYQQPAGPPPQGQPPQNYQQPQYAPQPSAQPAPQYSTTGGDGHTIAYPPQSPPDSGPPPGPPPTTYQPQPQQAPPIDTTIPPPNGGTMQQMQNPGVPATPEQAGF